MSSDVSELRSKLEGELVLPGDPSYEERRRIWNGMIDRRPAAIAMCASSADVVACVNAARDDRVPLAVRGGGHNVAGSAVADDALVVDLSRMSAVEVDREARTARAGGGATIGDLDAATQAHGLATPMGVVSETGISGLTLAGGIGWLRRKHGLACDNLIGAEVVLADGSVVRASEDEDADLLWGLRGGGGNFGAAVSLDYRLHEVGPEVMVCFIQYPGELAAEVLRFTEGFTADAPEAAAPLAFLGRVVPSEEVPERWHDHPFVAVAAVYAGDPAEGEEVTRPLRELGEPIADMSERMPYTKAQMLLDEEYPSGRRYYWKSAYLDGLGDEVVDRLIALNEAAPSHHSTIDVWYHGGAMSRVPPADTAFGDRSSNILIGAEANWDHAPDDQANLDWGREVTSEMSRFGTGRAYLNFPGFIEDGEAQLRVSYGENYDRLVALKTRYDPTNLFRLNQNIPPG